MLGKLEGLELGLAELELGLVVKEVWDMVTVMGMDMGMGIATTAVLVLVVTAATVETELIGAEIEGQNQTTLLDFVTPDSDQSFQIKLP